MKGGFGALRRRTSRMEVAIGKHTVLESFGATQLHVDGMRVVRCFELIPCISGRGTSSVLKLAGLPTDQNERINTV